MGHTLVSGPQGNLWMYGGLSLSEGILGNVYRWEESSTLNLSRPSGNGFIMNHHMPYGERLSSNLCLRADWLFGVLIGCSAC